MAYYYFQPPLMDYPSVADLPALDEILVRIAYIHQSICLSLPRVQVAERNDELLP
tara:strand:+ start:1200 stop:1364 length:165 start_codon:yes stop_codon:yes gene_type:complete